MEETRSVFTHFLHIFSVKACHTSIIDVIVKSAWDTIYLKQSTPWETRGFLYFYPFLFTLILALWGRVGAAFIFSLLDLLILLNGKCLSEAAAEIG
ncbi:hypothetical protein [Salibacterium sp. K-3]